MIKIVEDLRTRARIRREIKRRPEGVADRISDQLEEAASVIERLSELNKEALDKVIETEYLERSRPISNPDDLNRFATHVVAERVIRNYLHMVAPRKPQCG